MIYTDGKPTIASPAPAGRLPSVSHSGGAETLKRIAESVGYEDGADNDETGGIDALVDYKNALEDRLIELIDG